MAKDIHEWVRKVDDSRLAAIELVLRLQGEGVIVGLNRRLGRVSNVIPFTAMFLHGVEAETNIFFQLLDWQTDSDVVITNITTLPDLKRGYGFGSIAVQKLICWARENNLHEIRATQVGDRNSQRFWEKNGFIRCSDPNPCGDYVYRW
ncbi:MAG: GNAT family N-acetyltransferase [Candidatus Andersenbacteria bacterium]|nr:GNAT family N-acetyltransferase [Candidatus Andersenbacteria bacterium]